MVKILTLTNVIGRGRTGDCTLYRTAFSFAKGRNTGSEVYVSVALPRNLFETQRKAAARDHGYKAWDCFVESRRQVSGSIKL